MESRNWLVAKAKPTASISSVGIQLVQSRYAKMLPARWP
jgi:hypothetical protein